MVKTDSDKNNVEQLRVIITILSINAIHAFNAVNVERIKNSVC